MNVAAKKTEYDPVTLEVVRNKIDGISNEMQLTLVRSAFSSIVKEGLDASASMFTPDGEILSQALAIPVHLSALVPMVGRLLQDVPLADMVDGDVYILNDPYLGGSHIPDIAVMVPVILDGVVISICAALTHHQDMGGMVAGSTPTNATSIFQEGLRIPLIKLFDAGKLNETFQAILRQNVRIPDTVWGDLMAEVSACKLGVRRMRELALGFGAIRFIAMCAELLNRADIMTRDIIRDMPDGDYSYADYLDNDGIDIHDSILINVVVRIRGGAVIVDFTGTSDQIRGPFNCMPSGSLAAVCYALRAVIDPDQLIPNNGGCFRALSLLIPERSLLNPQEPAPVGCRSATIKRVASVVLGALRNAMPHAIPADAGAEEVILHFGGETPDGRHFVTSQILTSGSGAGQYADGVDVIETDATNCMNIPVEALEADGPIRVLKAGLAQDSGGPGKYRGGLGSIHEYLALQDGITFTYRGERHFFSATGVQGGGGGGKADARVVRANGSVDVIPSKGVGVLNSGDVLRISTAGGGGYGPASKRDKEYILQDVRNGKISVNHQKEVYGH